MKNKCHITCRAQSQLQHIEIWEKIDSKQPRYSQKNIVKCNVKNQKSIFLLQMAIWWRHNIRWPKMMHEIESTTHALSEYEIKNGGHMAFWRVTANSKFAFFLQFFSIFGIFARARILRFSARVLRYYRSRRTDKLVKIVDNSIRNPKHVKKRRFHVPYVLHAKKRARERARAKFFEMLKMAWNV